MLRKLFCIYALAMGITLLPATAATPSTTSSSSTQDEISREVKLAFALIGMPPLGGFAGKWMIAEAAVASVNPLAYAGIAALILSTLLTTLYMLTIVVRAYFPVGELDRAALARVHDPARTMWIPLVLLTASGVILALLSNEVIGFLWNAVPRNW